MRQAPTDCRLPRRPCAQAGFRPHRGGTRLCPDDQRRRPPRQYRPRRRLRRTRGVARRRTRGDRARTVLWLGAAQPPGADADARTGRRGDAGGRADQSALCRPAGDRPGRAGLLRAAAQGLHGRLGAALAECHAVRPCAALPRRRDHPGPGVLVGARPPAAADMARSRRHSTRSAAPDWMQEPCRSCAMRDIDFGGCRCQAMAMAGAAEATDPACELSPHHASMLELAVEEAAVAGEGFSYREPQRGGG